MMQEQINASPVIPAMTTPLTDKLKIVVGEAALGLIHEQAFIDEWDTLYNACPWATIFQEKKFAAAWYQLYNSEFTPIIVSNWQNGNLTGLLLLAQNRKDKKIQGAGGDYAYYKTWLSTESDNDFIKASLRKLIKYFPGHIISLSQLPPNTPISWIEEDPYFRKRSILRTISRPLVNLKNPEAEKLVNKKEFKSNCNRLKRSGELSYERVIDFDEFYSVLDELIYQYDFRQGAIRNLTPFRNSPARKQLLIEMFNQDMLHVTLLKLNNDIVASLVTTKERNNWMHGVGINSYSPIYANYSPGFICFVKFVQLLIHEGYDTLNMATGNQHYKGRLANSYDQVYELTVTNKSTYVAKEYLKASIRKHVKPNFIRLLKQYSAYLFHTKQKFGVIKNQGLVSYYSHYQKNKKLVLCDFRTDQEPNNLVDAIQIKRNSLQDLLCFDETKAFVGRQEFLSDAMKRFELGEQSFTWVEDGKLIACAWLLGPERSRKDNRAIVLPEGCAIIHGISHHTIVGDQLGRFLHIVKVEATRLLDAVRILAIVSEADAKRSKILARSALV
ncbi:GNAT family N-acetyltransferase [Pontibacter sp. FD36]|uniref:GNAT family N-acetyltransferase n=1 Tax=Pontibacter sp. FD36 TaxID=2789860 RepID=UPI001A166961|nr:GNAT family N-acetyltransferase [Pontibacter sp. FD36]MBF8964685.1 GNAT family N-acetyltransferase [Pontibacter sp. FD36]